MRTWRMLAAVVLALTITVGYYRDGVIGSAQASQAGPDTIAATAPAAPSVTASSAGGPARPASASPSPTPGASPPKAAPAPPAWAKAAALDSAVDKAMAEFPGRYSVVVHDLTTGRQWVRGGSDRYHPASTIKMPVSLYALEQFRAGKIGWYDTITYTRADYESPGGGAFETAPFGGKYPVENLVGRALRYSNNVAVNMLGRHLGWENIRAWTRSINAELYRDPDGSPSVTAMSELGWWLHLEKLSRTDAKNAELLLQPLREVAYDGRIAAGLPKGVPYVHKFGSYNGYYHDTGWVMREKPFLLVVLTHGAQVDEADAAIARLTAAVYKVMAE